MKILITILFCLFTVVGFSQITTNPYLGAPNTRTLTRGIFQSDSGAVVSYNFTDTTSANLGMIKTIPNILIIANDTVYKRSNDATAWGQIGGGGIGSITGTSDNLLLVNGTFLDLNKTFTALTYGATVTWNMQTGYNKTLVLTGNASMIFTNTQNGDQGTLILVQDGSGGHTLTVPSIQLTINPDAGDTTLIGWIYDGGTYYWAVAVGDGTNILVDGKFFVGDVNDIPQQVTPTGDVTFDNTGEFTIGSQKVVNSNILNGTIDLTTKVTDTLSRTHGGVPQNEVSSTSDGTPDPTGGYRFNYYQLTALSAPAAFNAPTGNLSNNNFLFIRVKDNGTARALTWDGVYRASPDLPLPSTTIVSKTIHMTFFYNTASATWDMVGMTANF